MDSKGQDKKVLLDISNTLYYGQQRCDDDGSGNQKDLVGRFEA